MNLYTLGSDAWSAWACDGNGNHSHYVIGNPTIVEVMNCYPGEDETVCGLCGGPFIHSGACVALEDTELLSTLDHRNDELRKSTVICVIPRGATYHILYNGDFPVVEYDGLVGYIAGSQVNFVDEEKCEDFRAFYADRRSRGLPIEKANSIYCRPDATDKEIERNILANPFKRFEDMQMMRHTKTLGIVEVDSTVWKKLSDAEKEEIRKTCIEKLDAYYARMGYGQSFNDNPQ